MRNVYAGSCRECGEHVAADAGYFEKQPRGSWPKWRVRCIPCTAKAKQARGAPLSFAQRDAIRTTCRTHGWSLPCKSCVAPATPASEGPAGEVKS